MSLPDSGVITVEATATARLTAAVLIGANALPILGVVLLGWGAQDALQLYWLENIVVGFFALLRIALVPGSIFRKLWLLSFFCVHFGLFVIAHGVLVLYATVGTTAAAGAVWQELLMGEKRLGTAALLLFISHGWSFIFEYLRGGERNRTSTQAEMLRPYRRVFIMHASVLLTFLLLSVWSFAGDDWFNRFAPAVILIIVKLTADLVAHRRSHA